VSEQGVVQEVAQEPAPEPTLEAACPSFERQAPVLCITYSICYFTALNVCRLVLCT
jgi:hypothetical protein